MIFFIIIAVLIVLLIVVLYFASDKHREKDDIFPTNIYNDEYRANIYDNTPIQYQQSIKNLYDSLDTLNSLVDKNSHHLNNQATQIASKVLEKSIKSEQELRNYWERNKVKANFYYYIGLHYTSFILADSLTEELKALNQYGVALTEIINSTQKQLNILKKKIESGDNSNIRKIKHEHHDLCKKCDALRKTRDVCNKQKKILKERRDRQNIITAQRRDYIGNHFGQKGRQWRARIIEKHKK